MLQLFSRNNADSKSTIKWTTAALQKSVWHDQKLGSFQRTSHRNKSAHVFPCKQQIFPSIFQTMALKPRRTEPNINALFLQNHFTFLLHFRALFMQFRIQLGVNEEQMWSGDTSFWSPALRTLFLSKITLPEQVFFLCKMLWNQVRTAIYHYHWCIQHKQPSRFHGKWTTTCSENKTPKVTLKHPDQQITLRRGSDTRGRLNVSIKNNPNNHRKSRADTWALHSAEGVRVVHDKDDSCTTLYGCSTPAARAKTVPMDHKHKNNFCNVRNLTLNTEFKCI